MSAFSFSPNFFPAYWQTFADMRDKGVVFCISIFCAFWGCQKVFHLEQRTEYILQTDCLR